MTGWTALGVVAFFLAFLSTVETAFARLWERSREGSAVPSRGTEFMGSQMLQFAKIFAITMGANSALALPIVAAMGVFGRERLVGQVRDQIFGRSGFILLVVVVVLVVAACAGLFKSFVFYRFRKEPGWRAVWLGVFGGLVWTWMTVWGIALDWRGAGNIRDAVVKNDYPAARLLLESDKPSPEQLQAAWNALAAHSDARMAALLLEHGASLQSQEQGRSALENSVQARKEELALFLLEKGAEARKPAILVQAAGGGMVALVRAMLKAGADANAESEGETPLLAAIGTLQKAPRALGVVSALVEGGADVNRGDARKRTPLAWATSCQRLELVQFLIEKGARLDEVNGEGQTPLHIALQMSYSGIARVLIEKGAPLDGADKYGRTPQQLTQDPQLLALMKSRKGKK